MSKFLKKERDADLSPVDYYNEYQLEHAKSQAEYLCTLKKGQSFKFDNGWFTFAVGHVKKEIEPNKPYKPITVLAKCMFRGSLHGASEWVLMMLQEKSNRYVRVGTDYWKVIPKSIDANKMSDLLKPWKSATITTQFGQPYLDTVPVFDDFTNVPNHIDYQQSIGTYYNLYQKLPHETKAGKWETTEKFLRHIFGEQYELGLEYLQSIYINPTQLLPVLCLVSEKRGTGKTTFLNFINYIYEANASVMNHSDLESGFNSEYSSSVVVMIDELNNNKSSLVERIKTLATAKHITMNQKFMAQSKVPFYGKIIITSNNVDSFVKVDSDEIRFWVRELATITETVWVNKMEDVMLKEIPAFLHHLSTMAVKAPRSRMVFSTQELRTAALDNVQESSKSWLYNDMKQRLEDWFNSNSGIAEIKVVPQDVEIMFYSERKSKVDLNFIRKVLKKEFKLSPQSEAKKYTPPHLNLTHLTGGSSAMINGRYYTITRESITGEKPITDPKIKTLKDMPFKPEQTALKLTPKYKTK